MKPRGYRELLYSGPIIKSPGNSVEFKTGSWRAFRPVRLEENCIHCLFCWLYCPDMAVHAKDGRMDGFDFDYCKGCGICAHECPGRKGKKAIHMQEEEK
ncbi:4Fe-4S binding protein [Candidatus Parcubacteria bacterium]|nr:4Fe-4S binding protein [Candidatus Parcubacteria bacterium]